MISCRSDIVREQVIRRESDSGCALFTRSPAVITLFIAPSGGSLWKWILQWRDQALNRQGAIVKVTLPLASILVPFTTVGNGPRERRRGKLSPTSAREEVDQRTPNGVGIKKEERGE